MKITIVGRQMTVRDSLKELVEKKLAKYDKYFGDGAEAFVSFSRRHNMEMIEVTISHGGTLFRSEEGAETFNNALDAAMDSLERQIRKNKTRVAKRLRSGTFTPDFSEWEGSTDEDPGTVIRTKTFQLKPMSPEEAILQMNLIGHQFFVFNDSESGDICVVYKRKDGDYGMIIPEK